IISPACRRRRVLIKWEARADTTYSPFCTTRFFLPFVDRHRREPVDLDQERDVGTGLDMRPCGLDWAIMARIADVSSRGRTIAVVFGDKYSRGEPVEFGPCVTTGVTLGD